MSIDKLKGSSVIYSVVERFDGVYVLVSNNGVSISGPFNLV